MNRFCTPLRLVAAAAVAVAVLGGASRAEAGFALKYSINGGPTVTVNNGDGGDLSKSASKITVEDSGIEFGSSSIGQTSTDLTTLQLDFAAFLTPGTYTIEVFASLTDLLTVPAPQPFDMYFTGSNLLGGGTYLARTWVDNNNALFGTSGPDIVLDTGDVAPGGSSSSSPPTYHADGINAQPLYSITTRIFAQFTVTRGASISLDVNNSITPAPAPAGLVLLASAVPVLGFGSWARRRRAAAAA